MPGTYKVVLTAGGKKYEQPLTLVMDPRVKTSTADLGEQFKLSKQLYDEWLALSSISEQARKVRGQLTELRPRIADAALKSQVESFTEKLTAIAGAGGGGFGGGGAATGAPTVTSTTARIRTLFNVIEEVDVAPTSQVAAAVPEVVKDSRAIQDRWRNFASQDFPALNQALKAAGLTTIQIGN
jgi:hypothetical protein